MQSPQTPGRCALPCEVTGGLPRLIERRRPRSSAAKIGIDDTTRQPQEIGADHDINGAAPYRVPTRYTRICDQASVHQIVEPVKHPERTDDDRRLRDADKGKNQTSRQEWQTVEHFLDAHGVLTRLQRE